MKKMSMLSVIVVLLTFVIGQMIVHAHNSLSAEDVLFLSNDEIERLFEPFSDVIHEINAEWNTSIMPAKITDVNGRESMIEAITQFTPESFREMIETVAYGSRVLDNILQLGEELYRLIISEELSLHSINLISNAMPTMTLDELEKANELVASGISLDKAIEMISPRSQHRIQQQHVRALGLMCFICPNQ